VNGSVIPTLLLRHSERSRGIPYGTQEHGTKGSFDKLRMTETGHGTRNQGVSPQGRDDGTAQRNKGILRLVITRSG
jgi:hypothetical protein